jgi:peptidoglycan/LPS O-acetylase OafA/YrhL
MATPVPAIESAIDSAAVDGRGGGASASRIRLLDFAKGVAILLIFGHHLARSLATVRGNPFPILLQWSYVPPGNAYDELGQAIAQLHPLAALELALASFGYIGVHIFVVASGYGLAYGMSKQPEIWSAFVLRRLRKLLPAFWLVVVGHALLLAVMRGNWAEMLRTMVMKATLVSFWDHRAFFSLNSPLWFLGLIIPLYLAFPLLYPRAVGEARWRTLAAFTALAIAVRWLLETGPVERWHAEIGHAFFVTRVPEFFLGMIVGASARRQGREAEPRARILVVAALIAGAVATAAHVTRVAYPALDPAFGVLGAALVALLYRGVSRLSATVVSAFVWIGGVSYMVYLVHRPIVSSAAGFLRPLFDAPSASPTTQLLKVAALLVLLALTLGVAWVLQHTLGRVRLLPGPRMARQPATVHG